MAGLLLAYARYVNRRHGFVGHLFQDAERRRGLWRQFVMDENAREREIERGDWALGEGSFRSRMAQVLIRPLPRHCIRPPKSTRTEERNEEPISS